MSIENADTADDSPTDDRFEAELVAVLRDLGEDVEPWKLRPPETSTGPAKLLVGAREGVVRGRLEGAGYEVRDLELPVERDGEVARGSDPSWRVLCTRLGGGQGQWQAAKRVVVDELASGNKSDTPRSE